MRPAPRPEHSGNFDKLVPPVLAPVHLEANLETRIGADISASGVVHSVPILAGGDAVSFRFRQCAASGSDYKSECEGRVAEHMNLSGWSLVGHTVLVRARIMVVVGGGVNQPEVSPMRLQKGRHSVKKCLSPRNLPRSGQLHLKGSFGPGNEVWSSAIQKENGDVEILVVE